MSGATSCLCRRQHFALSCQPFDDDAALVDERGEHESHDAARAHSVMEQHLRRAMGQIEEPMATYPEYFEGSDEAEIEAV